MDVGRLERSQVECGLLLLLHVDVRRVERVETRSQSRFLASLVSSLALPQARDSVARSMDQQKAFSRITKRVPIERSIVRLLSLLAPPSSLLPPPSS